MAFMEQQVTSKQAWYMIDGPMGTDYIPADVVGVTVTTNGKKRYATPDEIRDLDETAVDPDSVRQPVPKALADYTENKESWNIELIEGFGARLSANGYMDCTEWAVFDTAEEAQAYLDEYYPEDEDDEETERS
jgi:hypothetical protein